MNNLSTAKPYKGLPMEGPIATWYARLTANDLGRHQLMAAQLIKHIPAGGRVLEIAPGPGYFCIELARLGDFQITGLDISKSFVEIARRNAAAAGFEIDFRLGDAANMPFEDETFDFLFCQAAFKNFTQPVKAIAEMERVLHPGGLAVISDVRRDATQESIDKEIHGMGIGGLNRIITRWTFQNVLLKNAYSIDEMKAMVAQTPFIKYKIETSPIGFQINLEK